MDNKDLVLHRIMMKQYKKEMVAEINRLQRKEKLKELEIEMEEDS